MTPLVSIITPTYGREAFLTHARRWVGATQFIPEVVRDGLDGPAKADQGLRECRMRLRRASPAR